LSSLIQVLVSRVEVARHLGRATLRAIGLGMLLGPVSSPCSFAALSAARAVFAKGAVLIPALTFLFAFAALSVIAAIAVHWLFWALGLIPEAQSGRVQELARFTVDYTLFVNLGALMIAGALVWLARSSRGEHRPAGAHASQAE
jgi:hypothetical protein